MNNIKNINHKVKGHYRFRSSFLLFTVYFLLFTVSSYGDGFSEAWVYFLNEDYNISERIVNEYLNSGSVQPEYIYLKALLLTKRQRYEDARIYFDKLSKYNGRWAEYALVGRGDTYFLAGDFNSADTLYSTFLHRYAQSDISSEVLYKYALCLRKQGKWDEAKKSLNEIVKRYPDSLSSTYARRILDENEFYFTIQIGSFLNYDNAYSLSKELSEKGFDSSIRKIVRQGKLYYRVRVGRFNTRAEVDLQLRKLALSGYSGIIFP